MNESLRPWYVNGLSYVLGSGAAEQPAFFEQQARAELASPGAASVARGQQSKPGTAAGSMTRGTAAKSPSQQQSSPQTARAPTTQQPPQRSTQPQQPRTTATTEAPAWQQLTPRIKQRSVAVWTYWELGHDLLGEASDTRRDFLKQMIQIMRLPRGNIAFWPVAVPRDGVLEADARWFWRGVTRYSAEQVVCFGEQAAQVLDSEAGIAARQHFAPSVAIKRVPSVETLTRMTGLEFLGHLVPLLQAHQAL